MPAIRIYVLFIIKNFSFILINVFILDSVLLIRAIDVSARLEKLLFHAMCFLMKQSFHLQMGFSFHLPVQSNRPNLLLSLWMVGYLFHFLCQTDQEILLRILSVAQLNLCNQPQQVHPQINPSPCLAQTQQHFVAQTLSQPIHLPTSLLPKLQTHH